MTINHFDRRAKISSKHIILKDRSALLGWGGLKDLPERRIKRLYFGKIVDQADFSPKGLKITLNYYFNLFIIRTLQLRYGGVGKIDPKRLICQLYMDLSSGREDNTPNLQAFFI